MVGCFGDLYESVEILIESYMQSNQSKRPLIIRPFCRWTPILPITQKCFMSAPRSAAICLTIPILFVLNAVAPWLVTLSERRAVYIVTDALAVMPLPSSSTSQI